MVGGGRVPGKLVGCHRATVARRTFSTGSRTRHALGMQFCFWCSQIPAQTMAVRITGDIAHYISIASTIAFAGAVALCM